ncbi:hypothetical protein XENOCAPTIV_018794 [Xenoophorus captivus]|uniref:Uncharacterized protein n=1 Tax=Xenoophorus captivus TaxID=1517983 RepID=A0ABV0RJD9_9TELE
MPQELFQSTGDHSSSPFSQLLSPCFSYAFKSYKETFRILTFLEIGYSRFTSTDRFQSLCRRIPYDMQLRPYHRFKVIFTRHGSFRWWIWLNYSSYFSFFHLNKGAFLYPTAFSMSYSSHLVCYLLSSKGVKRSLS